MSNDTKGYNGFTNYETWCIHLWLTNEKTSYEYWREQARSQRLAASTWEHGTPRIGDGEREGLATQLKNEIEDASPLEDASLFSDLLRAALSEVDWYDVADSFLEDMQDPDPAEPESDQAEEDDEDGFSVEEFEQLRRERIENLKDPLFELGRTVITPEALSTLSPDDIQNALSRHHRGDWGDVTRLDWHANEMSFKEGGRLFSVYHSTDEIKFWVITEADHSSTCVLLPSDY